MHDHPLSLVPLRYPPSSIAMFARPKCTAARNTPARQIPSDLREDTRDVARVLAKAEAFEQSYPERWQAGKQSLHGRAVGLAPDRSRIRSARIALLLGHSAFATAAALVWS
jgi:hypothetical protein